MNRRPYRIASTRFHLLEALRAIGRVEDRDGLNAQGLLAKDNLIKALEKLETTKKRAKKTRVGSDSTDPLQHIVWRARADLAAASVMRRPAGPIITRATTELLALERAGTITPAQSNTAFERIVAHYAFTHSEVKGMNHLSIGSDTDLPPELGSYSDGVTDDAAYHPEIIGCGMPGVSGGLADLTVAGLPGYLFTKKNLSNATVRRRLSEHIKALAPKTRRRVLNRLRQAVSLARVSGEVRAAYPSIAGTPNVGWSGVMVSGARGGCPYANVAGPLTP